MIHEFEFDEADYRRARDIRLELLEERNYQPPTETTMIVSEADANEFRRRLQAADIPFAERLG